MAFSITRRGLTIAAAILALLIIIRMLVFTDVTTDLCVKYPGLYGCNDGDVSVSAGGPPNTSNNKNSINNNNNSNNNNNNNNNRPVDPPPQSQPASSVKAPRPSWFEIATKHGTDKVTTHEYHYMYEKYLPPLRDQKIKFLEIGLGCNMNYGPGKSYYTWLEYFPNIDLYYIEYDAACAEKWKQSTSAAKVFTGDQSNVTFLEEFLTKAGPAFDVIVDDGGHTMDQQIKSLQTLWRAVKPGGYYVLEDLQTSYMEVYGGDPSATNPAVQTTIKFISELIDDRMSGAAKHAISSDMRSIDCMREVCTFTKKKAADAI